MSSAFVFLCWCWTSSCAVYFSWFPLRKDTVRLTSFFGPWVKTAIAARARLKWFVEKLKLFKKVSHMESLFSLWRSTPPLPDQTDQVMIWQTYFMVFANNQITSVQQSGALGARLVNPISLAYKAPFGSVVVPKREGYSLWWFLFLSFIRWRGSWTMVQTAGRSLRGRSTAKATDTSGTTFDFLTSERIFSQNCWTKLGILGTTC